MMSPYFNKKRNEKDYLKDLLISNRYAVKVSEKTQKNKLVLIKHPFENRISLKILLGVEGDWIRQCNSDVYHRIPDGCLWVEDVKALDDSNTWGPVRL